MSQSALMAAVAARNAAALRAALVGEMVPVIPSATDTQTWDPRELGAGGGNVFPAVIWQERMFFRDPSDTTTAHDGISCLVTLDGSRYLTNDFDMPRAVLSRVVTTPPDPADPDPADRPDLGDAYLVPAAASGAWSAHTDDVALWTARGWAYIPPARGALLFIEDEGGYVHFTGGDAWANGIGAYALNAGSITPQHLLIRAWNVENQITNAPPANGPAGEQYIIGPAPTGAWAGNSKKIAYRPSVNAAFIILTPFVGEEIYDKSNSTRYRWSGASWSPVAGAIVESDRIFHSAPVPGNEAGSAIYAYSSTVAPTTAKYHSADPNTVSVTSRRSGQVIEFDYQALVTYSNTGAGGVNSGDMVLAVVRDAETTALDWCKLSPTQIQGTPFHCRANLFVTADDAQPHTYKFIFMSFANGGDYYRLQSGSLSRRSIVYRMSA